MTDSPNLGHERPALRAVPDGSQLLGRRLETGRLVRIANAIENAGGDVFQLAKILPSILPALSRPWEESKRRREFLGESSPSGLGDGGAAVWHDRALFAVSSIMPPQVSVDDGPALPMTRIPQSRVWVRVETIAPGLLHSYRFHLGELSSPAQDVAGYTSMSHELSDATPGSISARRQVRSRIYPGATTDYWLYVNAGIDEANGAPVMVWNDGETLLNPLDATGFRMQIVTDNLVHLGLIPPMVHVLISPSSIREGSAAEAAGHYAATMRAVQYDTVSDRYGRHLLDEVLPDADRAVRLRQDGYSRAAAGFSSGGVCAFTLAWFASDQFSRVHSVSGSFVGLRGQSSEGSGGDAISADLVRREPRRNIRVWISDGAYDLELDGDALGPEVFAAGSWPLNNLMLANALKGKGYDFHFRFGEGHHSTGQGALDLPESLAWLWRGYDPERTRESYEQETSERSSPVFRVRVANRAAW